MADWLEKSFDLAGEATKQMITLASGFIAITITFLESSLTNNVIWMLWSWVAFGASIIFGIIVLLALTGQANAASPTVYRNAVRVPSILQVLTFLVAIALTITFGWRNVAAQEVQMTGMVPDELADQPYVEPFVDLVSAWNEGSFEPPSIESARSVFENVIIRRQKMGKFGYETDQWVADKMSAFDEIETLAPQIPLDDAAAQVLGLAYSINLPDVRSLYEVESLNEEIIVPLAIVLSGAQQVALNEGREIISSGDVTSSIFGKWSGVFPFCYPIEEGS